MADTKVSGLPAVTTAATTDEFPVNQAGTSKKMTLAQVRGASAAPTVFAVGTEWSSTGQPTTSLPAGTILADDILIAIVQTSNQDIAVPTGWNQVGPQNGIGTPAAAGSTRLGVFWRRASGSGDVAPTVVDSGDHTYGVMLNIRGCVNVGDPFHYGATAFKLAAQTSTAATQLSSVVTVPNTLVLDIFAHAIDGTGGQASGTTTFPDVSSPTEVFDGSTTDGTGGGILVISGTVATPKPVGFNGNASNTLWASSTVDVSMRLHMIPADVVRPAPRVPEVQVFIGSPLDVDDRYHVPYGARQLFVQTCDGGGSGSGGNITTTAAGGGGGGGGGYDEAWYMVNAATGFPVNVSAPADIPLHVGKGGAAGTALNQAGNPGTISEFNKGSWGPLIGGFRIAGTAATAAASADGGNGGCGSGRGTVSPAVNTTRSVPGALPAANSIPASAFTGGPGGSGTTAPTGGSPGDWGGGGGESGADTDAALTSLTNGWSRRGGGGGGGGRTSAVISIAGMGGGVTATSVGGSQSTQLPYGGAGGNGGSSSGVTGGTGGFPGGGGGGGAGVAGGFGGKGGDGCIVITAFF